METKIVYPVSKLQMMDFKSKHKNTAETKIGQGVSERIFGNSFTNCISIPKLVKINKIFTQN